MIESESEPGIALNFVETSLVIEAVWARALGQEHVDPNIGFFDLGGTSVMILEVLAELRNHWPSLKVADIFYYPTVSQLAAFLVASL